MPAIQLIQKNRSTARFDAWGDTPEEAFNKMHDEINRVETRMPNFFTVSASHTITEVFGRFYATALVIVQDSPARS